MTEENASLFRLAHHDATCALGGKNCSAREAHARRNMSDTQALAAATDFVQGYEEAR